MNDDTTLSRQQLEATTAPELATGAPLGADSSAEAAALRECFLKFGGAVARAGEHLDEQALVARLAATIREVPEASAVVRPAARNRPVWLLVLGSALAASALIAVVRIASRWPTGEQVASSPDATGRDPAVSPSSAAKDAGDSAKLTSAGAVSSWDDPLDAEIATAESQLSIMAGHPAALDGDLTGIDQQLESLSSDLNGGSL